MREIVTLQLGHLSNYLATHFWNAQESYFTYGDQEKPLVDYDVHWRAGKGQDGADTLLPRTVVYDLKGGFGSLRKINPLYDVASTSGGAAADSLWSAQPATVHRQEAVSPSAYQQSLDAGTEPPRPTASTVRYWSDFSRVYMHPRSAVQLYDFELGSALRPFERFAMGAELFGSLDRDRDIVDGDWRPFVEECDAMQGIQVLMTLDDAWGGFAASYLEALRDEYPKSCIWVWALQAPLLDASRQQRQQRLVNTAQTLSQSCSMASVVVPLAIPNVPTCTAVDRASPWHVSGLLSIAMESAALPSRLAAVSGQRPTSLSDLAEGLNTSGRQTLVGASVGVGARALGLDADTLDLGSFCADRSNAPQRRDRIFGQVSTWRGLSSGEGPAEDATGEVPRQFVGDAVIRRYISSLKFPLLSSFPPLYSDASTDEAAVSVRAVLSTDVSMSARVKTLQSQTRPSVTSEDRETLGSSLMDIADAYQDGWLSGSDEGEDDL